MSDWLDQWVIQSRHATRAAAAARIAIGLSVAGLLLSNFATRDLWVGQASVWAEPARAVSRFPELILLAGVSSDILTIVYLITTLAAVSMVIGWHTKAANVVTFVGFIAIVGQNPVVGSQSDDLVRLTLLWMLLMRTADHWSLDMRRWGRLSAAGSARAWDDEALPLWLTNSLHNVGLFGLGVQTVLVYSAGGLDKVTQSAWQQGTALYYTMQLPEYRAFPSLSDLLGNSTLLLALLTYAVLLVQLFFGPLLLNQVTRAVVLGLAMLVSVFFAVVFALPWSSLATIAVTGLFVADKTWERIENIVLKVTAPVGDWLVERGFGVADRLDDVRHRFILPAYDRARDRVRRR